MEASIETLAGKNPRMREEDQAYKKACIRLGYEQGVRDTVRFLFSTMSDHEVDLLVSEVLDE